MPVAGSRWRRCPRSAARRRSSGAIGGIGAKISPRLRRMQQRPIRSRNRHPDVRRSHGGGRVRTPSTSISSMIPLARASDGVGDLLRRQQDTWMSGRAGRVVVGASLAGSPRRILRAGESRTQSSIAAGDTMSVKRLSIEQHLAPQQCAEPVQQLLPAATRPPKCPRWHAQPCAGFGAHRSHLRFSTLCKRR